MSVADATQLTQYSASYLAQAVEKLQWLMSHQTEQIAKAGTAVADAIERGGLWFVFGTGHSHMLAEEVFYRAGGMVPVAPILETALMLHESALQSSEVERLPGYAGLIMESRSISSEDVLLIASNSGRNSVPVEMAKLAKERGVFTIAITSLAHSSKVASRDPSGLRLFEVADLVIDNGAPYGDALVQIEGHQEKMGPISTVIGAAIMNAIAIEAAARLKARGIDVPTLVSANADGNSSGLDVLKQRRSKMRHL